MNTSKHTPNQASDHLALSYWLSAILSATAAAGCAISFFSPGLFALDHPALAGCTRGTALVMLVVAIPVLWVAMVWARRGSTGAFLIWAGMLAYLLYNSLYLTFGVSFNRLFLVYVAMLGLSFWALLALLLNGKITAIGATFQPRIPARMVAIFLCFPAFIFVMTDFLSSLTASIASATPASIAGTHLPTSPFVIVDLAVLTPMYILAAVWVWRREARGYAAGGILLSYYAVELLGIASDQVFGTLADPNSPQLASMSAAPFFVLLALVMSVPLVLLLHGSRAPFIRPAK